MGWIIWSERIRAILVPLELSVVGLSNGYERWFGYGYGTHFTDPDNPDSDVWTDGSGKIGDGMNDGWEVQYGLDPTVPSGDNANADGDYYKNREEYNNYYGSCRPDTDVSREGGSNVPHDFDPWRSVAFVNSQWISQSRPLISIFVQDTGVLVQDSEILDLQSATFTISRNVGAGGSLPSLTVYYSISSPLLYNSDPGLSEYTLSETPGQWPQVYSATIASGELTKTVTISLPQLPAGRRQFIIALTPYSEMQTQPTLPQNWEYVVNLKHSRVTINFCRSTPTEPEPAWWVREPTHLWTPQLGGGVWYQEQAVIDAIAQQNVLSEYPANLLIGLRSDFAEQTYRFDFDDFMIRYVCQHDGNGNCFYDYYFREDAPASHEYVLKAFEGSNRQFIWSMPVNRFQDGGSNPYEVGKGHGCTWQTPEYYARYLQYLIEPVTPGYDYNSIVDVPGDRPDATGVANDGDSRVDGNWGNLRAKRGHLAPYQIQAVILGVEPWGEAQESFNHDGTGYGVTVELYRSKIRTRGGVLATIPLGLCVPQFGPISDFKDHDFWLRNMFNNLLDQNNQPTHWDFSYMDVHHAYRQTAYDGSNGTLTHPDWRDFYRICPTAINNRQLNGSNSQSWDGAPASQCGDTWLSDFSRYLWFYEDTKTAMLLYRDKDQNSVNANRWIFGCAEHGCELQSGYFYDNDMGAAIHWALYLAEGMRYNAKWDVNWVFCESGNSHAQLQVVNGNITRTPGHYAYKMAQEFYGFEYCSNVYVPPSNLISYGTVPANSGDYAGTDYRSDDVVVRVFRDPVNGHYHLFVINKNASTDGYLDGWQDWTIVSWKRFSASDLNVQNSYGSNIPPDQQPVHTAPVTDYVQHQALRIMKVSVNHVELQAP